MATQLDGLASAFASYRAGDLRETASQLAAYGFSALAGRCTAAASAGGSTATAIEKLSMRIIDSRPAAGQGWVAKADAAPGSSSVPQLVRYTLEVSYTRCLGRRLFARF